jgi:hypothetical protein
MAWIRTFKTTALLTVLLMPCALWAKEPDTRPVQPGDASSQQACLIRHLPLAQKSPQRRALLGRGLPSFVIELQGVAETLDGLELGQPLHPDVAPERSSVLNSSRRWAPPSVRFGLQWTLDRTPETSAVFGPQDVQRQGRRIEELCRQLKRVRSSTGGPSGLARSISDHIEEARLMAFLDVAVEQVDHFERRQP